MVNIFKKIKSNKGASIFFALFVFLVCATVGSIVLASGTAAAGRISKISETDERYYSVMSAVSLLRNQIDGQAFELVRTKTVETTREYTITKAAEDGTGATRTLDEESTEVEETYTAEFTQTAAAAGNYGSSGKIEKGSSVIGDLTWDLLLGNAKTDEEKWEESYPAVSGMLNESYILQCSSGETPEENKEQEFLSVDVVMSMNADDGTLCLTVSSPAGETKGKYTVKMYFTVTVEEPAEPDTKTTPEEFAEAEDSGSEESMTQTSTEVEISEKTTKAKWAYSRIETRDYAYEDGTQD